jgi:predicted acetyltransferase
MELVPATRVDYPIIQNMGRFYEYEMSRYCGWPWEGEDSGYPSLCLVANFKKYFEEENRYPFLIKVDNELAGFVLINKVGTTKDIDWNMGEFFILAKFQGKGVGKAAAREAFAKFSGAWEVLVIPENTKALEFWRKAIPYNFAEKIVDVDFDKYQPQRITLSFKVNFKKP